MKTSNLMLTSLTQEEMVEINGGLYGRALLKCAKYAKALIREIAIGLGIEWLAKSCED